MSYSEGVLGTCLAKHYKILLYTCFDHLAKVGLMVLNDVKYVNIHHLGRGTYTKNLPIPETVFVRLKYMYNIQARMALPRSCARDDVLY